MADGGQHGGIPFFASQILFSYKKILLLE